MSARIHAAILGGAGYGAGELLRLLTQHPHTQVVSVTSTSHVGQPVDQVHPHLRGFYELKLTEAIGFDRLLEAEHAVVFSALPHEASGVAIDRLLSDPACATAVSAVGPRKTTAHRAATQRVRVIDLSGALRLRDERVHGRHYPDCPVLSQRRASFVYGLPELSRDQIRAARCVTNPGCLATAAILACAPLAEDGFVGLLAIDAKTGSSGSGRTLKATTHHPTRHGNLFAYKPLAHQHEPEILQALGDPHGERITLSFVPQSMDAARGIFVTAHAQLAAPADAAALQKRYESFYAQCPFVRVVDPGHGGSSKARGCASQGDANRVQGNGSPELQNVVGSNFCDVSVVARGRQLVAMAALDNLIKGMAGTAIQNMNLMCGLEETTGLWTPSLRPV